MKLDLFKSAEALFAYFQGCEPEKMWLWPVTTSPMVALCPLIISA